AVDRNGTAALESYRDLLGGDLDVIAPGGDTHDRFDDVDPRAQFFEVFGLMRRAPDVRVRAVRLLDRVAVREAVRNQPLAHLLASAELADELRVEPRLVDAQSRVGEQAVAVEPLNVVALVGGAVAPDVDAVILHRANQHGAGDGAAERGRVEVGLAAAADVEGTALQRDQALFDERGLAVDQPGQLGTVLGRPFRDRFDVGFVVLADVGRVGVRNGALLAHPRDSNRSVEAAREGDPHTLTNGQTRQYFRHASRVLLRGGWLGHVQGRSMSANSAR